VSAEEKGRLNEFVIKVATVNGTGSASANSLLMKAIFRMGVPVVGKNYFPSNIQGLPTWYEIRVCARGYNARRGKVDLMVAMNNASYRGDLAEVIPGGYFLYDSSWPRDKALARPDVTVLGVPLAAMCNTHFKDARTRILMKNMAYVGAVGALVGLDMDIVRGLIEEMFARKKSLIPSNMEAISLGYDYAREHFTCPLPFRLAPLDKTKGHILIDGNTATGLACVYAGATFGAWYPITPSTTLMDAFKSFCERYRTDPETGERRYCIVQAEDELASIGMAIGAGWNGARAFTPTSGPGISLMTEFLGFAYYAEIPVVVFDIQRVGPSTGMPTRTQQADILACAYASHGDTRHVLLFPSDPRDCFELSVKAFDLGERLQTPVIVLSDLDIGMNDWMCPDLAWDEGYRPDRGKVLSAKDLEETEQFFRFLDVDGDGIPYRTLPGVSPKGAYFTRGSGHNSLGAYTEDPGEYQEVVDRLAKKWHTAAKLVPAPIVSASGRPAQQAVIACGSSDGAIREALDRLADKGFHLDYMRVRAFPFNDAVERFVAKYERVFVVEQNRDAQLKHLIVSETAAPKDKLVSVLHYNGLPLTSRFVERQIEKALTTSAHGSAHGEAAE